MCANLSLLWPQGKPGEPGWAIPEAMTRDLGLAAIVTAMSPHPHHREAIERVLYLLCRDPEVIGYRQAVLSDLLRHPHLAATLRALLPQLDELALNTFKQSSAETSLQELTWRAGELELLASCVQRLAEAFAPIAGELRSTGLKALLAYVEACLADPSFRHMIDALPDLLAVLRSSASVTLGVNLDAYLRPEEVILLAVNGERFTESGLLARLLGKSGAKGRGVGRLHTLAQLTPGQGVFGGGGAPPAGPSQRAEPMLEPLFRDLARALEKATKPIAQELRQYMLLSGRVLARLRPEVIFYVYAVDLVRRLESLGLPVCVPSIAPADERVCEIEDAYNLHLALHLGQAGPVVTNDVVLGPRGRIVVLTGPNQGGKTTYLQAVGQAQIMAQAGLFVGGRQARISPVDAIFTHFPTEERLEQGTGRFGDEARRIRAIFEAVTGHSLVLLNETLAGTSAGESLYLARDLVRVLRQIGTRAIFTTHLHELAADVEALNAEPGGDATIVSMVALPPEDDGQNGAGGKASYRIVLSPPAGRSYAERIAAHYGIGYDQLVELLRQRQIIEP